MNLKILLPFRVFLDQPEVLRLVVETHEGSFGMYPHRLDCVAALTPGILIYETAKDAESFVAIDEGILVKAGSSVMISVRRAHQGQADLRSLRDEVDREFRVLDAQQQRVRTALAKVESELVREMARLHHG